MYTLRLHYNQLLLLVVFSLVAAEVETMLPQKSGTESAIETATTQMKAETEAAIL